MSKRLLAIAGVFLVFFSIVGIVVANLSQAFAQAPGPAAPATAPVTGKVGTGITGVSGGARKVGEVEEAIKANLTDQSQSKEQSEVAGTENIQVSLFWGLVGGKPTKTASGTIVYSDGLVGTASNLVVAMYDNPAANTDRYIADLMNSAHIAPPAYAQGLGFAALDPVLEVWKIFRNIAYFFFVVAFMVIGFLIMFRQKIGSQTVITAQQAIPSIIIALLAVTFSYAIAGLLIDLMYIIMYLMVGLFGRNSATLIDGNFIQLGFKIIGGATDDVGTMVSSYINDTLGGGIIGGLAGIAGGVTAMLIFAVAIAIGVFRLFFNLLRRYVAVIIAVTFAPLVLMMGAFPGKSSFGSWIKAIAGNLSAFPIVLMALIIADVMTGTLSGSAASIEFGGFLPPYLGGAGTAGALSFIVGLGILLVLSELVDKLAEGFGAGESPFDAIFESMIKNFAAGAPIGAKVGGGIVGAGLGAATGYFLGRRDSEGASPAVRNRLIRNNVMRYAGNFGSYATGLGGNAATAMGGRTPGALSGIDKGIGSVFGGFTDKAILKRAGEPEGGLIDKVYNAGALSSSEFDRRLVLAQTEKQRRLDIERELSKGTPEGIENARKLSVVKD